MSCTCHTPTGHTAYQQIGMGGSPYSIRSAEAHELGLTIAEARGLNTPAFQRTRLHMLADVPLLRPAGPEPTAGLLDLSRNEKLLLGAAAVALVGVFAWKRRRRRR